MLPLHNLRKSMGAVSFSIDVRLVERLKASLPLTVFFETGTFKGDSVAAMLPFFDGLITVELSEALCHEAQVRFIGQTKVQAIQGDSPECLTIFRPNLKDTSVLYWLDAHWCVADDTSGQTSQCPLLNELNAIGSLNEQSIVLIDDARLFLAVPPAPHEVSQWPNIDEVVSALRQLSSQHELTVVNDVIVYYPINCRTAITEYSRIYGVDWLRASQSLFENVNLRVELEVKEVEINNKQTALLQMTKSCVEKEEVIQTLLEKIKQIQDSHVIFTKNRH